mmetsp:Transcript_55600/g.165419  ORF Transcript_55600/g.165419 Transcript_55600/m.165419 type:complete len:220 (+) Transcript_55600:228-887(+)
MVEAREQREPLGAQQLDHRDRKVRDGEHLAQAEWLALFWVRPRNEDTIVDEGHLVKHRVELSSQEAHLEQRDVDVCARSADHVVVLLHERDERVDRSGRVREKRLKQTKEVAAPCVCQHSLVQSLDARGVRLESLSCRLESLVHHLASLECSRGTLQTLHVVTVYANFDLQVADLILRVVTGHLELPHEHVDLAFLVQLTAAEHRSDLFPVDYEEYSSD